MTIRAKNVSPTYAQAIEVRSNFFLFVAVVVVVVVKELVHGFSKPKVHCGIFRCGRKHPLILAR